MKKSVNQLIGGGRTRVLFLIFLGIFLISFVSAEDISTCRPLNVTGTYYNLTANVTSATTCFSVTAQNVTLDCNGYWINYSTGGTANTYGVYSTGRDNITIKNCNIFDGNWTSSIASRYGIYFTSTNNGTILNNFVNVSNSNAIYLYNYGENYNNLTSNKALSNSSYGIYIYNNSNNILVNNTGISNSNYGIVLAAVSNNTLTNNTGISNSSRGIYLSLSFNNTLNSNIGTTNSSVVGNSGIRVDNSQDNIFFLNSALSNSSYGIYFYNNSNNVLINNNGISNTSYGIYVYLSSNNTFYGNNGTSNSNYGIYILSSSNNNLTNNFGISNSSYGIYLSSSNKNNLTNNTGTSNSDYGVYLNNLNDSVLVSNVGFSDFSWGIYTNFLFNNTFVNFNWPAYSSISLKSNLTISSIFANLNSVCVSSMNSPSVNFNYKISDEFIWQNLTMNRTGEIYTLGDSITAVGKWQKSLDSYMGSNSVYNNFALSGSECMYSYERYVQNVTNSSNATVIIFCGANDVLIVSASNTTYYLEAMYNLSVERNQTIIFVNVGTRGLENNSCSTINEVNNWLLNFTQFHNIPLVDFHSFMSNSTDCYPNLTLTSDGIHPNNYGYRLLGKLIWEQGFNSTTTFNLTKPLIHFDQGKTYDIKCTSSYDNNTFQMTYTLPSTFISGGGVFGNETNISTTLSGISANINSTTFNSTNVYYGSTNVNITTNNLTAVNFNYNFSKYDFNFSTINITNQTVAGKEFLSVSGIADAVVGTKTVYVYNANTNYNSVCVKDEENVTSISSGCDQTNETNVLCDGVSHDGYTCSVSGTTLIVSGLRHSGIMQSNQTIPETVVTSSSPGSTSKPTTSSLTEGYSRNFVKGQKIEIVVDGEKEIITINKILENEVQFSVSGNNYSVSKNETKKFDLNSDGIYDLQISVEKIYTNGIAQMEFKLINEKIPSTEQTPAEEQTQNETPTEKSNNLVWIILSGIVLIGIILVLIKIIHLKRFGKKYGKKW